MIGAAAFLAVATFDGPLGCTGKYGGLVEFVVACFALVNDAESVDFGMFEGA